MATEGFDESAIPVRRGRRDPELALQMEQDMSSDEGEEVSQEVGLFVGDEIFYRVTKEEANPVTGASRWFGMGAKTSVGIGETSEAAARRIVNFTDDWVTAAREHDDEEVVARAAAEEAERRSRPIRPNR